MLWFVRGIGGAISVSCSVVGGRSPLYSRAGILMVSLDEMWARFSLTEEEKGVWRFLRMWKRVYTG